MDIAVLRTRPPPPVRARDRARDTGRIATARLFLAVLLVTCATPIRAGQALVAAAANFTEPAQAIARSFHEESGHAVKFSFGATGQLYAQIAQGAPFEVLLAADQERPRLAVEAGFAVAESRFTYAIGRLVLFSTDPARVTGESTLSGAGFSRLAIANPLTAPYGAAAVETMEALGVHSRLQPKLVQGSSIVQTYQFVATGNAELGFVALSQVIRHADGSRWLVPQSFHAPIAQDAVLLVRGADNAAARAFVAFLKGPQATAVIRDYGYDLGQGDAR